MKKIKTKLKNLNLELKKKVLNKNHITKWQKQNKSAIDAFNLHINSNGVFSDGIRSF